MLLVYFLAYILHSLTCHNPITISILCLNKYYSFNHFLIVRWFGSVLFAVRRNRSNLINNRVTRVPMVDIILHISMLHATQQPIYKSLCSQSFPQGDVTFPHKAQCQVLTNPPPKHKLPQPPPRETRCSLNSEQRRTFFCAKYSAPYRSREGVLLALATRALTWVLLSEKKEENATHKQGGICNHCTCTHSHIINIYSYILYERMRRRVYVLLLHRWRALYRAPLTRKCVQHNNEACVYYTRVLYITGT